MRVQASDVQPETPTKDKICPFESISFSIQLWKWKASLSSIYIGDKIKLVYDPTKDTKDILKLIVDNEIHLSILTETNNSKYKILSFIIQLNLL